MDPVSPLPSPTPSTSGSEGSPTTSARKKYDVRIRAEIQIPHKSIWQAFFHLIGWLKAPTKEITMHRVVELHPDELDTTIHIEGHRITVSRNDLESSQNEETKLLQGKIKTASIRAKEKTEPTSTWESEFNQYVSQDRLEDAKRILLFHAADPKSGEKLDRLIDLYLQKKEPKKAEELILKFQRNLGRNNINPFSLIKAEKAIKQLFNYYLINNQEENIDKFINALPTNLETMWLKGEFRGPHVSSKQTMQNDLNNIKTDYKKQLNKKLGRLQNDLATGYKDSGKSYCNLIIETNPRYLILAAIQNEIDRVSKSTDEQDVSYRNYLNGKLAELKK